MIRPLRSLSNRIFLASVLLAALSIGAALFFVRARLSLETQQALDRDLQTAASLADRQVICLAVDSEKCNEVGVELIECDPISTKRVDLTCSVNYANAAIE